MTGDLMLLMTRPTSTIAVVLGELLIFCELNFNSDVDIIIIITFITF